MVVKPQKSHGARSGLYGGCSNGVSASIATLQSRNADSPLRLLRHSKKGSFKMTVTPFSRSGWSVVRCASLAKGGTSKKRPSPHLHKVSTRSNKVGTNIANGPAYHSGKKKRKYILLETGLEKCTRMEYTYFLKAFFCDFSYLTALRIHLLKLQITCYEPNHTTQTDIIFAKSRKYFTKKMYTAIRLHFYIPPLPNTSSFRGT
jgi:hypothetical protein